MSADPSQPTPSTGMPGRSAEQIRRDVLDLAIPHAGSQAAKFVTVSVGLSMARPNSTRSLVGAIQMADEALYQAKREGRNRVICKDSEDSDVEPGHAGGSSQLAATRGGCARSRRR